MHKSLFEIGKKYDTDKTQLGSYIENYERHLGHLQSQDVKLLELGVFHGGSLLMWHEYFSKGLIVGLDIQPNPLNTMPNGVRFYQGSQDDNTLLDAISDECAPGNGFDITIDDASHIGTLSRKSFKNLFENHLKPGGVYVIEDWGTGYWETWPDGAIYKTVPDIENRLGLIDPNFASHNYGMVGFIKELIDELAWLDITFPGRGNSTLPVRKPLIQYMTVYSGQVFVVKAGL